MLAELDPDDDEAAVAADLDADPGFFRLVRSEAQEEDDDETTMVRTLEEGGIDSIRVDDVTGLPILEAAGEDDDVD